MMVIKFRGTSLVISVWLLSLATIAEANQFVDDYGQVHVLRDAPRVFCDAKTAISLLHAGMPEDWLVATWGMPHNRDSNLRHGAIESEYFTLDVQPEDLAILQAKISVSHPHCLDSSQPEEACWDDPEPAKVMALAAEDISLIIDMQGNHRYSSFPLNASNILDVPIVGIETGFDGAVNCAPEEGGSYKGEASENCYKRSYLDVMNRFYEMAEWMGIQINERDDTLCKATQRFQQAAEAAHDRGIRFLLASIQGGSWVGIEGLVMYVTNPLQFATARRTDHGRDWPANSLARLVYRRVLWRNGNLAQRVRNCHPRR